MWREEFNAQFVPYGYHVDVEKFIESKFAELINEVQEEEEKDTEHQPYIANKLRAKWLN